MGNLLVKLLKVRVMKKEMETIQNPIQWLPCSYRNCGGYFPCAEALQKHCESVHEDTGNDDVIHIHKEIMRRLQTGELKKEIDTTEPSNGVKSTMTVYDRDRWLPERALKAVFYGYNLKEKGE